MSGVQDATFRALVIEAHRVALEKAGDKVNDDVRQFLTSMEVVVCNRLETCAGRAKYLRCPSSGKLYASQIRLNYRLLSRNPKEVFFTYAHELAHIIAEYMHGSSRRRVGHGPLWKCYARALGDAGERCHSMNVEGLRRPRKRHAWVCNNACREYLVTGIRHNSWSRATATTTWRLKCPKCKEEMIYMGSKLI